MKKKAYYFDFDATIWLSMTSKIQLCKAEEKGIFIDLCAMCLLGNGWIDNDEFLADRLRVPKATLSKAFEKFEKLKLTLSDGPKMSVKFILEKLGEMNDYAQQQAAFGKKGGRPKRVRKGPSQEEERELEEELNNPPNPPQRGNGGGAKKEVWLSGQESKEFQNAFNSWLKHLAELAHKPVTNEQRAALLLRCRDLGGCEKAISAIRFSIQQGYKTICEPRFGNDSSSQGDSPMREY
jgi:hypothetical protein